jgi:hypothetical protein
MKMKLLLVATILIGGFLVDGRGDTLEPDDIHISGVIRQQSSTAKTGTIVELVTIPNILTLLGLSTAGDKDLQYYYDETTNAYVIAPKGTKEFGTGTPVATVFANGTFVVSWTGVGAYPVTTDSSLNATGLGLPASPGNVEGSQQSTLTPAKKTQTVRIQGILCGFIGGIPTVMEISVLDII